MGRRLLLGAVLLSAFLLALTANGVSAAEQAVEGPESAALMPAAESGGDEFHVSDATLTVAIALPIVLLGATTLMIVWAWLYRRRPDEEEEPMTWWRTKAWYGRAEEEE